MTSYNLDDHQIEAIYFYPEHSVIVEAPPGHGKTFVMARRVEYILQSGYIKYPHKILGLTFSNSAAGEMQDDIRVHLTGDQIHHTQIMTFHSFCYKVLRAYGNVISIPRDFMIIGEFQQRRLLNGLIKKIFGNSKDNETAQNLLEAYQEWIKENVLRKNPQFVHPTLQKQISQLHNEYRSRLSSTQIDYNQLLTKTIFLFEQYPNILEFYRATFRYVIVDEFQDTNPLQFALLSLIVNGANSHSNKLPSIPVFILADHEQAIYRFQGATPENIEKAKNDFGCKEIGLCVNYRTTSLKILNFTNILRGHDETLVSDEDKIDFTISDNPNEEAQLIFDRVSEYNGSWDEICVIAQNKFLLNEIREAFSSKIPYIFVPDFRSNAIEEKYESAFESISRLSNGKITKGKLTTQIVQIFRHEKLNWKQDDVLCALYDLAMSFEQTVTQMPFQEKARLFYNDIFIEIHWGNLLRKRVRDKVFLSTIHGVKGLQFSQVHLCGLVNYGHIHHTVCYPCCFGRNLNEFQDQLHNALNMLYVGVTRAQDDLFLYAVKNAANGKQRSPICLLQPVQNYLNLPGQVRFCGQSS